MRRSRRDRLRIGVVGAGACRTAESALSRQLTHFIGVANRDVDATSELDSIAVPHALAYRIEDVLGADSGRAEAAAAS